MSQVKSIYILAVSLAFSTSALAAPPDGSGEKKRLQLKVLKHQPCTAKPLPSERIRFPSIDNAPWVKDAQRGDGCYFISGPVTVSKPIRGTVQVYVETRSGTNSPIEKCNGADSSGCGGVGSCVYCDLRSILEEPNKSSGSLQILSNGTPLTLDFKKGFEARNYSDMRLSLCMPTKEEFLKTQGMDEDSWNQYRSSGRPFFLTIYVFNRAINTLSTSDLQKIASTDSDQIIGCHRIVGTVVEPNN